MRPLAVMTTALLFLAGGCALAEEVSEQDPTDPGRSATSSAPPSASAAPSDAGSGTPSPAASPAEPPPGPDEVLAGCSDARAEELGDVVGGADLDGDGELEPLRYVGEGGRFGVEADDGCARALLAYTSDGIAGFRLEAGAEAPDEVTALQPGGEGSVAYASFRTTAERGGYQQHLLALAGSAPDLRLAEISLEGSGDPLLPFVATDTTGVRAGFLCSDGELVAQVGEPRSDGGQTVWDITTSSYEVQIDDRSGTATAVETSGSQQTGVADDALEFGFPALLPESSARICS